MLPTWADAIPGTESDARRGLEDACDAVGGRSSWLGLPAVTAALTDTWSRAARAWRPPTPEGAARFTVHFEQDKARIDFADPAATCWGHDSREGWTASKGSRTYADAHHAERVVPTLKWFAAMPHKLLDPGVEARLWRPRGVDPASPTDVQVLVRFGTEGGRTGDRMMATLRRADRRLIRLAYTARAFGENIVGMAEYVAWSEVDGVLLPSEVMVGLHAPAPIARAQHIRFEGWTVAPVPASFFEKPPERPQP